MLHRPHADGHVSLRSGARSENTETDMTRKNVILWRVRGRSAQKA